MKHEFSQDRPAGMKEDRLGELNVFRWLDLSVTAPNLITLITTRKANGAANACLNAWGMLVGSQSHYSSMFVASPRNHTSQNVLREKEWCVCIPSRNLRKQCFQTIRCNGPDNDEVTDAGLTVEPAVAITAPRIAECPIVLECRLSWHRSLSEGEDYNCLFVGRVVHVAMDESVMASDPGARLAAAQMMYNVQSPLNPLSLERGPDAVAGLSIESSM